jgi:peptidoglycan/LPS O-acetylase OafA/YrhL
MKDKRELLRHVPELDGVRGLAILMVMVLHFHDPVEAASPFGVVSRLIRNGGAGVDLFFVLSGFLITGILVSSKSSTNYFSAFYARRILRIFPLYLVVTGLFFAVALPLLHRHGKDIPMHASEQIWYWLFLENWPHALGYSDGAQLAHFWSLAIEEQFYLVWSLVVWKSSVERLKQICLVLIVCAVVGRTLASVFGVSPTFLYFCTFTRMDSLLLGALLALSPGFRSFMGRNAKYFLPASVPLVLLAMPFELNRVVYEVAACSLIGLATVSGTWWLRAGWLRSFGKYSFALYILHDLLHSPLVKLSGRFNPVFFAICSITGGIACSYGLAMISWKVLEQPFLRLKKYWPYRFPESATIPSAVDTRSLNPPRAHGGAPA